MSEPTKGPWFWDKRDNSGSRYSTAMPALMGADGAEVFNLGDCETYYPTEGTEPSEADKSLIAAAPELLEDAKSTDQGYTWFREQLENFKAYQGSWTLEVGDNWADSLIAHIKSRQIGTIAAIAKAEVQ